MAREAGMNTRAIRLIVGLSAIAAVHDCRSSSGPSPLPTVLVNIPACTGGPCGTTEVREFDWNLTIPQMPWGFKVVGEVHGSTACLTLPAPWTFTIEGPDSTGKVDTTVFKLNDHDRIFLAAMDSVGFHTGSKSANEAWRGNTKTFTASDAPGWQVTFSGDTAPTVITVDTTGTLIAATNPCTP
jgi:hypothetical protein